LKNRFHQDTAAATKRIKNHLAFWNVMIDERSGERWIDCCNVWMNGVRCVLSLYAVEIQVMPVLKPDTTRLNRQTRLKRFNLDIRNLSDGR